MLTQTPTRANQSAPVVPLTVFAVVAVAALFGQLQDFPLPLRLAIKTVPLILLLFTTARGLRNDPSPYRIAVTFGLAASMVGDVWIAINFLGGIAAFFVAHLGYLAAMGVRNVLRPSQAIALLPGLALWGGMFQLLTPRVPADLFIPVVAYLTVISLMWLRALGRAIELRQPAAWILFAGATSFVISDSMIAINRWLTPIPYERVAIMATYYAAQWMIARSVKN
jgi:uncharacterized membrane protein YhhN